MSERFVLEALQKKVTAVVAAIDNDNLPDTAVQYVGRVFDPPENGISLEVVYVPNNKRGEFWDDGKTYRGVMRLILHWPVNDQGAYPPLDLMQSVVDQYTVGEKLQDLEQNVNVTVTEEPNIMNVIKVGNELLVPVSVRYNFFRS